MIRLLAACAMLTLCACSSGVETGSAVLTCDSKGWLTTDVTVNGEGPFAFILDTGAQRAVISPSLAARLKLPSVPGVTVEGASGTGSGSMIVAPAYKSGLFDRSFELIAVMPEGGAVKDGVIGMSPFVSGRLEIDFTDLRARDGASVATPKDFAAVPARIVQDSFVIVPVLIDGVRAQAMIDTGSLRTTGNLALRDALGFHDGDPRLTPDRPVGGATRDKIPSLKASLGNITLGEITFSSPVVNFAASPTFGRLGLDKEPAIIIGLDELTKLKALAIDYPRAELQIEK